MLTYSNGKAHCEPTVEHVPQEPSLKASGRPKSLVAVLGLKQLRKETFLGVSTPGFLSDGARAYKAAGGHLHASQLAPLGTFRSWEAAGEYPPDYLKTLLVIISANPGSPWVKFKSPIEEALGIVHQPADKDDTPDPREHRLLTLLVRHQGLLKRFQDLAWNWSARLPFLRTDRLLADYLYAGTTIPAPLSAILFQPRAINHSHFAVFVAVESTAHAFFATWRRHAQGLWLLRQAFAGQGRFRKDRLQGLSAEPGYTEARELQGGLFRPSLAFFGELEASLKLIDLPAT